MCSSRTSRTDLREGFLVWMLACAAVCGCGADTSEAGDVDPDVAVSDTVEADVDPDMTDDSAAAEAAAIRACLQDVRFLGPCPCGESVETGDLCCSGDVVMMCDGSSSWDSFGGGSPRSWRAISEPFEDSCNRRSPVPPRCVWLDP